MGHESHDTLGNLDVDKCQYLSILKSYSIDYSMSTCSWLNLHGMCSMVVPRQYKLIPSDHVQLNMS